MSLRASHLGGVGWPGKAVVLTTGPFASRAGGDLLQGASYTEVVVKRVSRIYGGSNRVAEKPSSRLLGE
jgi:hypothetical protein